MSTPDSTGSTAGHSPATDFIRKIVVDEVAQGKNAGKVRTRFPPEPNGYLHIGHAKAICIDFGIAQEFGGECNLRFDDTNPTKESTEYVEAIKRDVKWLGFNWAAEYYASDYFPLLHEWAVLLIKAGKAYVDSQSPEEISATRGTPTVPGKHSPYRDRSVAENLDLFERMRKGEFKEGACCLRAKIDMGHPNFNMRDPVMVRILHAHHHRTGDAWCIYPMYDWAHGQNDWMEGITHSICTLEFEHHRPLYDWFIDQLIACGVTPPKANGGRPRQIEFARLELTYTLMSKRKLLELVTEKRVNGWDDPRMPTLCGLRRRGCTPEALRAFCDTIGVSKYNSTIPVETLELCMRDDLNKRAPRGMGVVNPLKVTIENYPADRVEEFDMPWNGEKPDMGTRKVPFTRELWIEQDDFREDPPKDFFRLAPGKEVRLRYAYYVTCKEVKKDASGKVVELICTYDPATKGGSSPDGRKVKGTIHWVSATKGAPVELRLYNHLFKVPEPGKDRDWREDLNPESLVVVKGWVEPALLKAEAGTHWQFERVGYFCADPDGKPGAPVFNRTVSLKDSYAKQEAKEKEKAGSQKNDPRKGLPKA